MNDLVNAQLGRILLGVAVLWTGAAVYLNAPQPLPAELTDVPARPVHVELDVAKLKQESDEAFFRKEYRAGDRLVFHKPQKAKVYEAVQLDEIPTIGVMRPPQLLTDPGPSLEGAHNLPRWGREYPEITVTAPANPRRAD